MTILRVDKEANCFLKAFSRVDSVRDEHKVNTNILFFFSHLFDV